MLLWESREGDHTMGGEPYIYIYILPTGIPLNLAFRTLTFVFDGFWTHFVVSSP